MDTERLETPAFTIEAGTLTRHALTSSRTALRFIAPAERHLDGGFDATVSAILYDARDRFIARKGGSRDKTILGSRAVWVHELDNDWLAQAARVTYEIDHRVDFRRKIVAGELPQLPAQADVSDYYRWLDLDPRTLEDRVVRFDFALWARASEVAITVSQTPKLATDSCRSELELDLLDGNLQLCFSRPLSIGLNYGQPSFDDTSITMDRPTMRALRFFELRGRTDLRGLARLVVDGLPS
jgi:hypothetical protein